MNTNLTDRPYLICHILMSLDGRISGNFFSSREVLPGLKKYGELRSFYNCPATIYGTTTLEEGFANGRISELPASLKIYPREDYLVTSDEDNFIIALDPEGILNWDNNYLKKKGRPKAHIIEILTEKVSNDYLSYLRNLDISYIIAGKDKIDCNLLLQKLKTLFGFDKVMLAGGGLTDWSFATAGLIDELSIILVPLVEGDSSKPSLFESGSVSPTLPVPFSLKAIETIDKNILWLRYISINKKD